MSPSSPRALRRVPDARGPAAWPRAAATVDSCASVKLPTRSRAPRATELASRAPPRSHCGGVRVLEHLPRLGGVSSRRRSLMIVFMAAEEEASPGSGGDRVRPGPHPAIRSSCPDRPPTGDCACCTRAAAPPRLALSGARAHRTAVQRRPTVRARSLAPHPVLYHLRAGRATPGIQADCVVEQTITRSDGSTTTSLVPSCDESAPPCWSLGKGSPLQAAICQPAFGITQAADYCPDWLTRIHVECLGCLTKDSTRSPQPK